MVIEILERGINPEEKVYVARCYRCKTKVKFRRKDADYVPGYDQRDGSEVRVTCPVCNGSISDAA